MIEGSGCFLKKESPKLELCIYHHPVNRISMTQVSFHLELHFDIVFVVEILAGLNNSISTPDGNKNPFNRQDVSGIPVGKSAEVFVGCHFDGEKCGRLAFQESRVF